MSAEDYVYGAGKLYFAPYKTGTTTPEGFRYLGNSPSLSLTFESEKLDHYNSDSKSRQKDKSVTTQVNRTMTFTLDEITPENVGLFFMTESDPTMVTSAGATIADEAINDVKPDRLYQLGATNTNPTGNKLISGSTAPVVTNDATPTPTTYVAGTDYVIDALRGHLRILATGSIAAGTNLKVSYTTLASTRSRVVSGGEAREGALLYVTDNATGQNAEYLFPDVLLSPDGDLEMKGDSWQEIGMTGEILVKGDLNAIYRDGIAYDPS